MPVYTVGNEIVYDAGLRLHDGKNFYKVGRNNDYAGGFACKSPEDAGRLIIEFGKMLWAVYELDAEWGVDTVPSENGDWHALIRDALVVRKIDSVVWQTEARALLMRQTMMKFVECNKMTVASLKTRVGD